MQFQLLCCATCKSSALFVCKEEKREGWGWNINKLGDVHFWVGHSQVMFNRELLYVCVYVYLVHATYFFTLASNFIRWTVSWGGFMTGPAGC